MEVWLSASQSSKVKKNHFYKTALVHCFLICKMNGAVRVCVKGCVVHTLSGVDRMTIKHNVLYSFFKINLFIFIYLVLAALGLSCCAQAFSSCFERGLLFVAVHGLLIAVASLVAEHGL